MYFIYNILLLAVFAVVILPFFLWRTLREDGFATRFKQSLGFLPETELAKVAEKNCIWIHGASVGEIVATSPLVKEIKKAYPDVPILVSAVTCGGYSMAKQIIPEATVVLYFPLDMYCIANWVIDRIKPRIFMPVETELWPNFLRVINKRDIPVMLVNGRISDKSVKRYRYMYGMLRDMMESVDKFCMQSELDAHYIQKLGGDPRRIVITGNTKFDKTYAQVTAEDQDKFLTEMSIKGFYPVVVAGSTHPGEEEILFAAFKELLQDYPQAKLVLAPRKPARVNEITEMAKKYDFSVGYRKALQNTPPLERVSNKVVLLDTIGELGRIYAIGDIIYVGGSLVAHGGHNMLEPAAHGKAMIVGPHMFNFKETYSLFTAANACITVADQHQLAAAMLKLAGDKDLNAAMSRAALEVVYRNCGASERTVRYLQMLLDGESIHGKTLNYAINNATSRNITIEEGRNTRQGEALKLYFIKLIQGKHNHFYDYAVLAVLRAASWIYDLAVRTKLLLYQIGIFRQTRLDCLVISIGNITVGGTGKTPTVQKMATMVRKAGYKALILNRGYSSKWEAEVGIVSDGKKIFMTANESGDEAYLLAKNLPEVPVVIGTNRAVTGKYVTKYMKPDVIFMDDGYQHWPLARDIDIVLIDALNMLGSNSLLPRGTLREPLSHLNRADLFLITRADQATKPAREEIKNILRANNDHAFILESTHTPSYFVEIADWYKGVRNKTALEELCGEPVMSFSAIGNPASFEQTLSSIGVDLIETIRYPDHHDYGMVELQYVTERAVQQKAKALITTEKDAVKIPSEFIYSERAIPIYILGIEIQVIEGDREFGLVIRKLIEQKGRRKR